MLRVSLCVLLASASAAQSDPPPAFVANLSEANRAAWVKHILPAEGTRTWAELPWHMSFGDGLADAAKTHKPLLLWVMNGHPFGCT